MVTAGEHASLFASAMVTAAEHASCSPALRLSPLHSARSTLSRFFDRRTSRACTTASRALARSPAGHHRARTAAPPPRPRSPPPRPAPLTSPAPPRSASPAAPPPRLPPRAPSTATPPHRGTHLPRRRIDAGGPPPLPNASRRSPARPPSGVLLLLLRCGSQPHHALKVFDKIGRASCRERV